MTAHRKDIAAFTIILGVLTLILTVSAFAEKAHGEHLPEQHGRGTTGALISTGIPVGILILLSSLPGFARLRHRFGNTAGNRRPSVRSCRMGRDADVAMEWPMRPQSGMCPVS